MSESSLLDLNLSEAHRHVIGLPSIFGDPDYPQSNHWEFHPTISFPIRSYARSFCHCFIELTHTSGSSWASLKRWARTTMTSGRRQLAVHKTVHTTYFALDYLRKYIQLHPFTHRTVNVAGILFNAIMEAVGLPSLNIDFADEMWAYYTMKAVDGDIEPLLRKVFDELVSVLEQLPSDDLYKTMNNDV